ncbi:TorF family putative porin [Limnohabitans lacus]|uniref:TorF family putative porin n=1 Tax=Limnohabitans lacus TaxID=3045173 RepID=A0ABT6X8T1_9BURK|nr:TorF family putative porin [Limnohabitans sp. HM2-2]MDI9234547.1 TorF family putative porin [Limnohabitans sp. HM2-2]
MKKILVPSLIALAVSSLASVAQAQTAPESTLSYNVGVVTDYRYRGISQSRLNPAVQGGVDYADKSGFYVGAWGSSIKWIKDAGASAGSVEIDLYGGYKGTAGDVAYDVGFLRYEYSGNKLAGVNGAVNANTNEVYGAATYGLFTAKYSHAISDLFGNANSKNSYYLDLSAALDLGEGYSLTPHVGRQTVKNTPSLSYNDFSLTLGKDLGNGLSASAAVVDTTADKTLTAFQTPAGKFTGKTGVVLGLKYSF